MATHRPQQRHGRRSLRGFASLLVILLVGPAAWPRADALDPGNLPPRGGAPRVQVAVQQGRLSVDLWEADLGDVLAQIRQKAGIPIIVSPNAGKSISAQFTGVALEPGLRRLLQLAAQSYAIRYAPGPAGVMVIQEVRVFGTAPAEGPVPVVADRAGEDHGAEAGQHFVEALVQHHAASPAFAGEEESAVARRFREALERSLEPTPVSTDAPESEAARHFRDTLEGAIGATRR
jgi:hypothetical protein